MIDTEVAIAQRTALVTGAGGAIGAAIAGRLARRGIRVAVNDVDLERATAVAELTERATGTPCAAFSADVCDRAGVAEMAAAVADKLGTIGILVNNAGVLRNARLEDLDDARWNQVIDVHLRGAFLCSQAVIRDMKATGWGRIVNISSGAVRGSHRGQTNYATAKAGLIGMAKTLAVEHGPFGITANVVAPGAIRSDMTRATADQLGISFAEYEKQISAGIARRRLGEPEDVATAVDFFTTEAADFITGQVLYVSGSP
ncbi:MAG: SDR family NAD(P)-dependent oxidoreductase [Nakamurella sp.]